MGTVNSDGDGVFLNSIIFTRRGLWIDTPRRQRQPREQSPSVLSDLSFNDPSPTKKPLDPTEEVTRLRGPRKWPTDAVRHSPRLPRSPISSPTRSLGSVGLQSPPPRNHTASIAPSPFTKCLRSMGAVIPSPTPTERSKRKLFPDSPDGKKALKVSETTRVLRSADVISPAPATSSSDSGYLSTASSSVGPTPRSSSSNRSKGEVRKSRQTADNVRKRLSFGRI